MSYVYCSTSQANDVTMSGSRVELQARQQIGFDMGEIEFQAGESTRCGVCLNLSLDLRVLADSIVASAWKLQVTGEDVFVNGNTGNGPMVFQSVNG